MPQLPPTYRRPLRYIRGAPSVSSQKLLVSSKVGAFLLHFSVRAACLQRLFFPNYGPPARATEAAGRRGCTRAPWNKGKQHSKNKQATCVCAPRPARPVLRGRFVLCWPKSFAEIGSIATSAAPGARSAAAGRRRNTAAIGAVAAIHRKTSVQLQS